MLQNLQAEFLLRKTKDSQMNFNLLQYIHLQVHSREIKMLHFCNAILYGVLFKVLNRENEPSNFQEKLIN